MNIPDIGYEEPQVQSRPVAPRAGPSRTSRIARGVAWLGMLSIGALSGCGGGGPPSSATGAEVGSIQVHAPGSTPSSSQSQRYIVDSNSGGQATSLRLREIRWGRLANVYSLDNTTTPQFEEYLVDEAVATDNIDYRVALNPNTQEFRVDILHAAESAQFKTALEGLQENLVLIQDKSLDPSELPPFPLVPRNAALMLQFDDLLDPETIVQQSIQLRFGYPPATPFDARVLVDYNHGDLADFDGEAGLEFYTTRVIIDTTVSSAEAVASDPPLPVNEIGLPASITQNQPNIAIRIPTRRDEATGQLTILANPSEHFLGTSNNGSIDINSPTLDIVRAVRSGGSTATTGDVNNGFLLDNFDPSIIGVVPVRVTDVVIVAADLFIVTLEYPTAYSSCANRLQVGDVIESALFTVEVVCPPGQTCSNGIGTDLPIGTELGNVYVRLVGDSASPTTTNNAQLAIRFNPTLYAADQYDCFVRFPGAAQPPADRVSPSSSIIVRFSEPMDPASMTPFDSMTVTRDTAGVTLTIRDYVVGSINASTSLKDFTFVPTLPFRHTSGLTESYLLTLLSGDDGPRDLSGNALSNTLSSVSFRLDPAAATENTRNIALRFSSDDEGSGILVPPPPGTDGNPEVRGQFLLNLDLEALKPRPVVRYPAISDRSQPVPSLMQPFPTGVQTPLSKLGSKLQTIWRYCDVGFALSDEQNFNVDIEGISWAPAGGAVIADTYARFEISLAHSNRLPDETLNAAGFPNFPNSGLVKTYVSNAADTLVTVHAASTGATGYDVNPTDVFLSDTGTVMMPWPLNRTLPSPSQYSYFTWRDTAVLVRGALPDSPGAELPIVLVTQGCTMIGPMVPGCMDGVPYDTGLVPTVGLPILMEFRCYPDNLASGLNAFDISLATASSARPNFRAFSTGGLDATGNAIAKNPDLEQEADGGFNPTSVPPGQTTQGVDNSVYLGQLDLVTRISRAHSVWFDTGGTNTVYAPPVVEPRAVEQPQGTRVDLAFRGATLVSQTGAFTLSNSADTINPYGDPQSPPFLMPPSIPVAPTFLNGDATWTSNLTSLNTAKFFQFRITFISNTETGLVPSLSAVGFAFRN